MPNIDPITASPTEFQAAIAVARKQHGSKFYTEGGCAILAALLAEIRSLQGFSGEFLMIIVRDEEDEGTDLSHVCFLDHKTNESYDIFGAGAEERWINMKLEEAEEQWLDEPCFADGEDIPIQPDTDIMATLIKLSDDYHTNINSDWVREHYAELRSEVLAAVNLKTATKAA